MQSEQNFRPVCRNCGSPNTHKRGRNQWQCSEKGCKKYFRIPVESVAAFGGYTQISAFVPGILSDTELMEQLNIDPTRWRITKVQYDRRDTYKGDTINPMVNVRVSIEPKVAEIAMRDLFAGLLEDAKAFSPKYPKISYPKQSEGLLYELAMPDIHLGLLAWAEESGTDSDLKITEALVNAVTDRLLSHVRGMSVSRILFPVGNDYFNVNDKKEETIHGTRQQEDTRWQKTFRKGHQLMVQQIDKLQTIAPVDVLVIPGNHDEERAFYMGEVLSAWYRNCPNVTVDNRAVKRKYYAHGVNLIGLTHGYYEKPATLCNLMPLEVPQLWAASKYREFHLGDKHHKKDMITITEEFTGVVVRILRALSAAQHVVI